MLKGFIVGLALTIIVGQVPKLFGVDGGDGDFFQRLWEIGNLGETERDHDPGRRSARSPSSWR